MTTLTSYDLNGKKLSFANWISNLSPQETPFTSMTGKESVQQTLFQWQTDHLAPAMKNAQKEGTVADNYSFRATQVKTNITQILRKTVKVSDTANALANYGRGKEIQYQMEKAGKELKRDLEFAFLNNINSQEEHTTGGTSYPRKTAGFEGLVAPVNFVDNDTKAVVHKKVATSGTLTETELFDLTYNLYLAGSHAHIIMFHPAHAAFFSALQEKASGTRLRIFENTPKFSVHVTTIVDPLGQEYKLIPNRWMPEDKIFFFCHKDWTQMVLRAPSRTKLAKDGSYEKWMIEMEVGLRHRNPFASGILDLDTTNDPASDGAWGEAKVKTKTGSAAEVDAADISSNPTSIIVKRGDNVKFTAKLQVAASSKTDWGVQLPTNPATYYAPVVGDRFALIKDGKEMGHWALGSGDTGTAPATLVLDDAAASTPTQPTDVRDLLLTAYADTQHIGLYHVVLQSQAKNWQIMAHTASVHITVA